MYKNDTTCKNWGENNYNFYPQGRHFFCIWPVTGLSHGCLEFYDLFLTAVNLVRHAFVELPPTFSFATILQLQILSLMTRSLLEKACINCPLVFRGSIPKKARVFYCKITEFQAPLVLHFLISSMHFLLKNKYLELLMSTSISEKVSRTLFEASQTPN